MALTISSLVNKLERLDAFNPLGPFFLRRSMSRHLRCLEIDEPYLDSFSLRDGKREDSRQEPALVWSIAKSKRGNRLMRSLPSLIRDMEMTTVDSLDQAEDFRLRVRDQHYQAHPQDFFTWIAFFLSKSEVEKRNASLSIKKSGNIFGAYHVA